MKKSIFSLILSFILLLSVNTNAFAFESSYDDNKEPISEIVASETLLTATGDASGFTYYSSSHQITLTQNCNMLKIRALSTNGSTNATGSIVISGLNPWSHSITYDNVLHTYYSGSSDQNIAVNIPAGTYTVYFTANDGGEHQAAVLFYHR